MIVSGLTTLRVAPVVGRGGEREVGLLASVQGASEAGGGCAPRDGDSQLDFLRPSWVERALLGAGCVEDGPVDRDSRDLKGQPARRRRIRRREWSVSGKGGGERRRALSHHDGTHWVWETRRRVGRPAWSARACVLSRRAGDGREDVPLDESLGSEDCDGKAVRSVSSSERGGGAGPAQGHDRHGAD